MQNPGAITDAIVQSALSPKRIKENGRETEEHNIDQLIKADSHIASKVAGRRNHMGIRFSAIVPPGAG